MTDRSALMEQFIARWRANGGEALVSSDAKQAGAIIEEFIRKGNLTPLVFTGASLMDGLVERLRSLPKASDITLITSGDSDVVSACSEAVCGVSGVEAMLAATGTLVLSQHSLADRLVSLLPEVHIAVADGTAIFADLEDFLSSVGGALDRCLISGPSRTADIEKQVVIGAHGPRRTIVLLVG